MQCFASPGTYRCILRTALALAARAGRLLTTGATFSASASSCCTTAGDLRRGRRTAGKCEYGLRGCDTADRTEPRCQSDAGWQRDGRSGPRQRGRRINGEQHTVASVRASCRVRGCQCGGKGVPPTDGRTAVVRRCARRLNHGSPPLPTRRRCAAGCGYCVAARPTWARPRK